MRFISLGLLIACGPGNLTSFDHNGDNRQYVLHAPENPSSDSLPLLLNLHGFGGTANDQMAWADMRDLANSNNFLLV